MIFQVMAEYAVALSLKHLTRTIYTSPIKVHTVALSPNPFFPPLVSVSGPVEPEVP